MILVGVLVSVSASAGPTVPNLKLDEALDAVAVAESDKPLRFGTFRYHRNTHTLKCMGTGQNFRCDVAHSNGQRVGSATAVWRDSGSVTLQLTGRGTCPKEVRFKASDSFLAHLDLDQLPAKI